MAVPLDPNVEILTRPECLALLADHSFGRVGVSIDALPVILPVHFTLFGDSVFFRTIPGTRLDDVGMDTVLAFQADEFDRERGSGWTVLLQGFASEPVAVEAPAASAVASLPRWGSELGDGRLVRIEATAVTGRQFRAVAGGDPGPTAPGHL